MVSFLLKRFGSSWSKIILVVVVILGISGLGLSFYVFHERTLVFHQDWTEADRRQMKEISGFVKTLQKQDEECKAEEFGNQVRSLPFGNWDNWPELCALICKYYKEKWERDMHFHVNDTIVQTARTGNAAYIGKNNYTLLQFACALGKRELACHLMDKGADVNIRSMVERGDGVEPGDAAINWLAAGGLNASLDEEMAIFLMKQLAAHGADLNLKTGEVLYPFEVFCNLGQYDKEGRERVVLELIDLGADVSSPLEVAGKGRSAFVYPVKRGLGKVVRRLCEMGVDVNEGYDALPPLFCLDPFYDPVVQVEIARMLLDYGAQINTPLDPRRAGDSGLAGQTPLIHLCTLVNGFRLFDEKQKKTLLDLFSLYCERKVDVNQPCEKGSTPLMYLFENVDMGRNFDIRLELARQLLSNGADPSLKNNKGKTVLDMIGQHKKSEKEILEKLPGLGTIK